MYNRAQYKVSMAIIFYVSEKVSESGFNKNSDLL